MTNAKKPGEQKSRMGIFFFFSFPSLYRLGQIGEEEHTRNLYWGDSLYILSVVQKSKKGQHFYPTEIMKHSSAQLLMLHTNHGTWDKTQ